MTFVEGSITDLDLLMETRWAKGRSGSTVRNDIPRERSSSTRGASCDSFPGADGIFHQAAIPSVSHHSPVQPFIPHHFTFTVHGSSLITRTADSLVCKQIQECNPSHAVLEYPINRSLRMPMFSNAITSPTRCSSAITNSRSCHS